MTQKPVVVGVKIWVILPSHSSEALEGIYSTFLQMSSLTKGCTDKILVVKVQFPCCLTKPFFILMHNLKNALKILLNLAQMFT